jgi:hypothetical protein
LVAEGDHEIVVVNWPLLDVDVCGVAPVAGAVITTFAVVIVISALVTVTV